MLSASYICLDLLHLILRLFPVQTLVQCRCVCKSWKQLIDSTSFILDHLSLQTPRTLLKTSLWGPPNPDFEYIVLNADDRRFYDTLRGPDGGDAIRDPVRAGCSAHGVICIYGNDNSIVLWNPSIRRQLSILAPETCPRFDRSRDCLGFWMDPCSREFKIVHLSLRGKRIGLYSSRKKEWVEFAMHWKNECGQSPQVLIGRVAHWAATHTIGGLYVMLFFDFGQHKFGTIDLPFVRHKTYGVNVNVYKGQGLLSVVLSDRWMFGNHNPFGGYIVYVMQNGSWSTGATCRMIQGISQVLYDREDSGPWVLGLTSVQGELVLYDREDEGYIFVRPRNGWPTSAQVETYSLASDFVESLVFPDQTR